MPLTGRYAAGGDQVRNGYQLAVDDINAAGGVEVAGKKIPLELVVVDDESDPTKTTQRMETLATNDKVIAYLGGFGSDLHAAAAGIAEKNKIPYLGVAFALYKIHQQGYKYLFSPFPKSPDLAKATFDIFDTLNPKPAKIAIFAEKTDWGNELGGGWRDQAKARGYEVVVDESVRARFQRFFRRDSESERDGCGSRPRAAKSPRRIDHCQTNERAGL